MPTTDCATDIAPPPSEIDEQIESAPTPGGASKLLKGLLIGFAATVTIGLALATWYLGARIVAANASAQKQASAPAVGEFYLQVGAFGPNETRLLRTPSKPKDFSPRFRPGMPATAAS